MPTPRQLDFHALHDGVIRNNVGVGGITLAVRGRIDGGEVVVAGTDQRLPVTGATAAGGAAGPWLWFEVEGYEPGQQVSLVLLGSSPEITTRPAAPLGGELDG